MPIAHEIKPASVDELCLDPLNPRLGRRNTGLDTGQERIRELMRDWTLDELAISFMESGFWPQEALLIVREQLYGAVRNVVVEGNRRLAALLTLREAVDGHPPTRKWADIAASGNVPEHLFDRVPTVLADSRADVEAFLGFRHVTGIREWDPAEKAEFIARLVDRDGLTYEQVMRKIGSKTEPVRRNYIAYCILLQLEKLDGVSVEHVEERFSVLFLSLREPAVQRFLGVDLKSEPEKAKQPVPAEKLSDLKWFTVWLFGSHDQPPLFTDSREVMRFADILASSEAVKYLQESRRPSFEVAWQKSGADEPQLVLRVQAATDEIEQALGRVHLYTESEDLQRAVNRFGRGAIELLRKFPSIYDSIVQSDTSTEREE